MTSSTGVQIVLRALEEPVRQIAINAGVEGSVVVENIKSSGKTGCGYDAAKDVYADMDGERHNRSDQGHPFRSAERGLRCGHAC